MQGMAIVVRQPSKVVTICPDGRIEDEVVLGLSPFLQLSILGIAHLHFCPAQGEPQCMEGAFIKGRFSESVLGHIYFRDFCLCPGTRALLSAMLPTTQFFLQFRLWASSASPDRMDCLYECRTHDFRFSSASVAPTAALPTIDPAPRMKIPPLDLDAASIASPLSAAAPGASSPFKEPLLSAAQEQLAGDALVSNGNDTDLGTNADFLTGGSRVGSPAIGTPPPPSPPTQPARTARRRATAAPAEGRPSASQPKAVRPPPRFDAFLRRPVRLPSARAGHKSLPPSQCDPGFDDSLEFNAGLSSDSEPDSDSSGLSSSSFSTTDANESMILAGVGKRGRPPTNKAKTLPGTRAAKRLS
jgi:hypothetical protein